MRKNIKRSMVKKRVLSRQDNLCYLCEGRLENTKEIITKNNKIFTMDAKQCSRCGHSFSTLEEAERVRKEVNPSFLTRIKRFFSSEIGTLSIFKGRVL